MVINVDVDTVIRVPVTEETLYYKWMLYTKPIHKLTLTEIGVAAALLKHRDKLKSLINDPMILDREVLGNTVRDEILKECGITIKHYRMIMTNLRKSKFIEEGHINERYIIDMERSNKDFRALLQFDLIKKK